MPNRSSLRRHRTDEYYRSSVATAHTRTLAGRQRRGRPRTLRELLGSRRCSARASSAYFVDRVVSDVLHVSRIAFHSVVVEPDDIPRIQRRSKELLGNAYRLQTAAAVAESHDDELYPEAVAERASLKEARAGEQLRHFAKAGMLEALPKDGRKQPYKKHDSMYWDLCQKLLRETLDAPA